MRKLTDMKLNNLETTLPAIETAKTSKNILKELKICYETPYCLFHRLPFAEQ